MYLFIFTNLRKTIDMVYDPFYLVTLIFGLALPCLLQYNTEDSKQLARKYRKEFND